MDLTFRLANFLGQARTHGRSAAWALAEQGANPLVNLALTPYLLARLGRQDFGVWTFALTLVSMSQLVSFGAGVAATKHVSADLGAGNPTQTVAAIRAALTVAMVGGCVAAGIAWLFANPIAAGLFGRMGPAHSIATVIALCGLAVAIQEIDNVFAGSLRGAERFDLCAKIEVPVRLAMGCVLAYLGSMMARVPSLLVALVAMMALKSALKAWAVACLFQNRTCCLPSFEWAPLRRVLGFGLWQWLQTAGTVFFATADQLLVGGLLGAAALARYSVCLQIAQYVHMVPSVMMQVIFPRLSALGQRVDPARGNRILRSTTIVAVAIALALGLPIMLLGRWLLSVWIGAEFAADNHWLLIVLVAVHITLAFNIGSYFVLLGSGRAARSAAVVLLAGTAQFVFAFVAAPYGIIAVACNRFVYSFLTAWLYKAARYPIHAR